MHLYNDQFSVKHDYPEVEKANKTLIIASTGRSGSHMLGHALHETNCFGFPLEYVNPANFKQWQKRFGLEKLEDVLKQVQKHRTSPNGVFGIKIHYSHIQAFGGFRALQEIFPDAYYVLLTRQNIVKQAVSLSLAKQTGVWIADHQPSLNDKPVYDGEDIDNCLRELLLDNTSWKYQLLTNQCKFMEMTFEQVCGQLQGSISDIARFMDVEVDGDSIPETQVTKKQANIINKEWEKRFLSEGHADSLLEGYQRDLIYSTKSRIKKFTNTLISENMH